MTSRRGDGIHSINLERRRRSCAPSSPLYPSSTEQKRVRPTRRNRLVAEKGFCSLRVLGRVRNTCERARNVAAIAKDARVDDATALTDYVIDIFAFGLATRRNRKATPVLILAVLRLDLVNTRVTTTQLVNEASFWWFPAAGISRYAIICFSMSPSNLAVFQRN